MSGMRDPAAVTILSFFIAIINNRMAYSRP